MLFVKFDIKNNIVRLKRLDSALILIMSSSRDENSCTAKFVPFQSTVESSFWMKLGELKLDRLRLNEEAVPLTASYSIVTAIRSRAATDSTQQNYSIANGRMRLDQDSFIEGISASSGKSAGTTSTSSDIRNEVVKTHGKIIILNTLESFKTIDKNELLQTNCLNDILSVCSADGAQEEDIQKLISFFCLTFLDLKNHKVLYWFAFPALATAPGKPISYSSNTQAFLIHVWGEEAVNHLDATFHDFRTSLLLQQNNEDTSSSCPPFFIYFKERNKCLPLNSSIYTALSKEEKDSAIFVFLDPTIILSTEHQINNLPGQQHNMGWPLRNLVAYLSIKLNLGKQTATIISYRPGVLRRIILPDQNNNGNPIPLLTSKSSNHFTNAKDNKSLLFNIDIPCPDDYLWSSKTQPTEERKYRCMGWELNARAKPGPRSLNLAPLISSSHLAQQATDLNLKLMKWRMIPNLDLAKLSTIHVLLIGAGTLGCSVARTLLGWGVRKFTFVDNGKVSYSNPVRQNLFELKDCENGGTDKAMAAAEALKRIAGPTIQTDAVKFTIPMPGHSFSSNESESVHKDVDLLDQLVKKSDVVFLLTDTRESRWLPTVLARAHNKMLINAALGLDSWLVMRHGGICETKEDNDQRLGCYFCNDIVAAQNSTRDRTLDQQCTVTRPGLAPIASSMAVELMVALLHHPEKHNAPAPVPSATSNFSPTVKEEDLTSSSPLGVMPHQIRGSIVTYTMMTPTVPAFRYCTGCCDKVVSEYKSNGFEFVKKVCCDPQNTFLEELVGLTKFKEEAANKMLDCDWDEDDDDDDAEF